MNYTVEKLDKNQVKVVLSLDKDEWQAEVESAYNRHKGRYNIEGFRKGKAPRKVIEKVYGENVFFEDALSEGFYKHYYSILQKEPTLLPIDSPKLNILEISSEGVKVEALLINQPEVALKKYKGFGIKSEPRKVNDDEIEVEVKKLLEQNVRLVESAKPAELGSIVNIDFEGSINGKVFEGGTSKGYDLELGTKSFIDTFEDQLIGVSAEEEKDVNVTFPTDYGMQEYAGKPALFKVKVNSVKVKEYPEFNDEFISDVTEHETVADYKAGVRLNLEERAVKQAKIDLENKIIEKVLENLEVELPKLLVDQELDHLMQDLEMRLMYQGATLEQYAEYLNTTVEELKEQRRDEAEKSVKVRLALQYIMREENLNVTDEEVEDKIKEMAKSAKKTIKEYKELIDEHRMSHIKNDILMDKLLNFLVDNN